MDSDRVPKIVQTRASNEDDEYNELLGDTQPTGTDFNSWTEDELRAFLDQRGEDYDDCTNKSSLVTRAQDCERNTGAAVRPNLKEELKADEDDEIDPLDAFMAEMQQIDTTTKSGAAHHDDGHIEPAKKKARKAIERMDNDEDHLEDFLASRKRTGGAVTLATTGAKDGENIDDDGYDSDEAVYATAKAIDAAQRQPKDSEEGFVKRDIEPLAPLDHSTIDYEEFNKDFYEEVAEISAMDDRQVAEYRKSLGVRVSGYKVPKPVQSFVQCGFDPLLKQAIVKAGYTAPTPIQAQTLPVALSGRDVLGIAKTGSGKTAAFVLPMIVHIMDQPELAKGEGPIGIIVAPTRELAEQIHREARKFSKPFNLKISAAFGGLSKHTQFKELKAGADAAVCTPGRMIDLVKMKACTLRRTTYLVFDEADRLFDMGFEPQIRSIIGQVRPDRQTLLFSATMPRKVGKLAAEALTSPVRITVGEVGAANEDVKQIVEIVDSDMEKLRWVSARLSQFVDDGDVLIFANQKAKVDEVATQLASTSARVQALHGDMDQHTRMEVLKSFKSGAYHVLVATDVAARGLDIRSIKTVINYDAAKDMDTHVHRIGRTGRAGDKEGVAYTLLLPDQSRAAADIVQCLAATGQEVPEMVHQLAMRDSRFSKGMMHRGGKGKWKSGGKPPRRGRQLGGGGLGFNSAAGGNNTAAVVTGGSFESGHVTGFAPSHAREDVHFGTSGGTAPHNNNNNNGSVAAATANTSTPAVPPPFQQQQAPAPRTTWGEEKRSYVQQNFRSGFVSSGTTGGDIGARPEIVLPRNATTGSGGGGVNSNISMPQQQQFQQHNDGRPRLPQNLPPPPVPVTQQPLYLQRQQQQQQGYNRYNNVAPPLQQTEAQAAALQQAVAQAQAIAARLSQKHPGAP